MPAPTLLYFSRKQLKRKTRTENEILDKLSSKGYEAVIIGGCVRDSIMGIEPHDWDIATSAQPEEIMECFKRYNLMKAGIKTWDSNRYY